MSKRNKERASSGKWDMGMDAVHDWSLGPNSDHHLHQSGEEEEE